MFAREGWGGWRRKRSVLRARGDTPVYLAERLERRLLLSSYDVRTLANFNFGALEMGGGGLVADSAGNLYGASVQQPGSTGATLYELPAGGASVIKLADFSGIPDAGQTYVSINTNK